MKRSSASKIGAYSNSALVSGDCTSRIGRVRVTSCDRRASRIAASRSGTEPASTPITNRLRTGAMSTIGNIGRSSFQRIDRLSAGAAQGRIRGIGGPQRFQHLSGIARRSTSGSQPTVARSGASPSARMPKVPSGCGRGQRRRHEEARHRLGEIGALQQMLADRDEMRIHHLADAQSLQRHDIAATLRARHRSTAARRLPSTAPAGLARPSAA